MGVDGIGKSLDGQAEHLWLRAKHELELLNASSLAKHSFRVTVA